MQKQAGSGWTLNYDKTANKSLKEKHFDSLPKDRQSTKYKSSAFKCSEVKNTGSDILIPKCWSGGNYNTSQGNVIASAFR